ncbi:MFS transporter [Tabrizicola sp.]|uniref:MFS transporter n=1 Tax=Tabrizicola sp. TaxID=2005166 RepID=UPI00273565CF|nr:MFS transporter [Tabrizicola sp.]MDP3196021.1 MFS transporter [Tabrizicola sp.]
MISLPTLAHARPAIGAFAAMGVLWGTFAAVLPDLKLMLGVDEAQLGLLIFCTPIAAISAMLVAPTFGAAMGRAALPVAVLMMALTFMLPGQASVWWLFPLAMACAGAATGLTDVLMNARVAAIETERGLHLMNLAHAAYSFGYAGGAVLTGVLRGAGWGPDWVMGTMAVVGVLCATLTIERDGRIDGLRRPRDGTAVPLGLVPVLGGGIVLIAFMTENAAENWSALHIEKTLGGSPEEGALGPAMLALTMGFARLGGQWLAGKVDAFTILRAGAVIAAVGALVVAQAPSPLVAYLGFFVMGIGASVLAPTAFSLVGQMSPDSARARAVARATLLGYFGYFVGPPLLGVLAGTFGLRFAFVWAACLVGLVFVLAPILRRQRA